MITQIQFHASRNVGARLLSQLFASLPRAGEEDAWDSPGKAAQYCATWPPGERADVGGFYIPYVPDEQEDGVTTIVTPSSRRPVSFYRAGEMWTVDFLDGSLCQAAAVLDALTREGITPSNVART